MTNKQIFTPKNSVTKNSWLPNIRPLLSATSLLIANLLCPDVHARIYKCNMLQENVNLLTAEQAEKLKGTATCPEEKNGTKAYQLATFSSFELVRSAGTANLHVLFAEINPGGNGIHTSESDTPQVAEIRTEKFLTTLRGRYQSEAACINGENSIMQFPTTPDMLNPRRTRASHITFRIDGRTYHVYEELIKLHCGPHGYIETPFRWTTVR
jgi:hypothetical protein